MRVRGSKRKKIDRNNWCCLINRNNWCCLISRNTLLTLLAILFHDDVASHCSFEPFGDFRPSFRGVRQRLIDRTASLLPNRRPFDGAFRLRMNRLNEPRQGGWSSKKRSSIPIRRRRGTRNLIHPSTYVCAKLFE